MREEGERREEERGEERREEKREEKRREKRREERNTPQSVWWIRMISLVPNNRYQRQQHTISNHTPSIPYHVRISFFQS
jgi:hypothetical protein